jgi:hypothetical protein
MRFSLKFQEKQGAESINGCSSTSVCHLCLCLWPRQFCSATKRIRLGSIDDVGNGIPGCSYNPHHRLCLTHNRRPVPKDPPALFFCLYNPLALCYSRVSPKGIRGKSPQARRERRKYDSMRSRVA